MEDISAVTVNSPLTSCTLCPAVLIQLLDLSFFACRMGTVLLPCTQAQEALSKCQAARECGADSGRMARRALLPAQPLSLRIPARLLLTHPLGCSEQSRLSLGNPRFPSLPLLEMCSLPCWSLFRVLRCCYTGSLRASVVLSPFWG